MEQEPVRNLHREDRDGDHRVATISLIDVPHPHIPNLYQRCFEYLEPWQWSPATELVETGQWFFAPLPPLLAKSSPSESPPMRKPGNSTSGDE